MADLKSFADNHKIISDNYRFWKFLREEKESRVQFFFDTADIIDMLTGMQGLSQGYAFKWGLYEHLKQLVYAVAYQEWLGPITLLSPHLTELYDKINTSHFLFPDQPGDIDHPEKEFWGRYIPKEVRLLIEQPQNGHWGDEVIHALMEAAPHIFQGVYLLQKNSFWKKRYKSLKERKIIHFDTTPYDVIEISKDPIFKILQSELNKERPYNTSNNYIDAMALCLFDRKLQAHEGNPKQFPLPIFYSDQEHLLNAVQQLAKREINDRHPLSVKYKDGETTLLVRDANFFFLSGILQGAEQEDFQLFDRMTNCFNSLKESYNQSNELSDAKEKMDQNILEDIPLTLLLEFFKRWWHTRGIHELKEVFEKDYNLAPQQEKALNLEVENYIAEQRKCLEQDLGQRPFVLKLLQQAWKELHEVDKQLQQLYPPNLKIDTAHEFGSRFSFNRRVYGKIQDHFDRLKAAAVGMDARDIDEVKTETVNYIFDALTARGKLGDERRIEKLDNLASAMGILWLLEKYELIDDICKALTQSSTLKKEIKDEYPSPAFAIMHAATLLSREEPNLMEIQRIINCVENKFNSPGGQKNYKVWMGLSYIYYRMAAIQFPHINQTPEDLLPTELKSKARKAALDYLKKTCQFAEQSITYLEEKIADEFKDEGVHRWRRVYYYATNNMIFCKTIMSPTPAEELAGKIRRLSSLNDSNLYHENRYSDTIARYYYRLAHLCPPEHKSLNIKLAENFNKRSLTSMGTAEKRAFETLSVDIAQMATSLSLNQPFIPKVE